MMRALGWSLLHFVWQGAAAAALLAALNVVFRHARPEVRYRLAAAALLAMLLMPAATLSTGLRVEGALAPGMLPRLIAVVQAPDDIGPAAGGRSTGAEALRTAGGDAVAPRTRPAGNLPAAAIEAARRAAGALDGRLEPLLPAVVVAWGIGVLILSLRSLGGFVLVERLRRRGLQGPPAAVEASLARLAERMRLATPVRLFESALVRVPTVVGWLRPVVLLPASAISGLTAAQLELILAHELAHVRRADYLVNLLQTAAETLLFYHPAVWWVSHRMRVEREHCCDDLAVAACGSAVRYARALADLRRLCGDTPALAMAASGGSLFERVARLVGQPPGPKRSSRALGVLFATAALGLSIGFGSIWLDRSGSPVAPAWASAAPAEPADPMAPAAVAEPSAGPQEKKPARPEAATRRATPAAATARAFPLDRILELARAGVTPEYVGEMDGLGYASLDVDELIQLRQQGVDPDYVRALQEEGYRDLSADKLMSLRAQGVSPEYVRALEEQGVADLSVSDLLALRAQGVSPEFVAELRKAGYEGLPPSKLMALRSQGVSGRFASELSALGYAKLSLPRLLALSAQGVTPEYVRELAGLGYTRVDTAVLLGLRSQGVTPDYVRGLKEAGYEGLAAGMLIELRAHGVTPEYVRELEEAGYDKVPPEKLIEMRSLGLTGERLKRLRTRQ